MGRFFVVAAGGCVLAGFLGLPLLAGVAVSGGSLGRDVSLSAAGVSDPPTSATVAPVSAPTVTGIPGDYLVDLDASAARFDIPWSILAGIYKVECDFGQSSLRGCAPGTENAAGAQGPGQFLAPTWRRALRAGQLIALGPPTVSVADGFATDGDGDGVADPWDPADAVASTARMLAADGGVSNIAAAVWAYNHSETYVDAVLSWAGRYQAERDAKAVAPVSGSTAVARELAFAVAQLGKPYRWGGAGPSAWDCSGLVQASLRVAGLAVAHNAATQYAQTDGRAVSLDALAPGDLVFYGPTPATIHHVGIYVGAAEMIDAPHTGAVVRVEPIAAKDLLAATRPL